MQTNENTIILAIESSCDDTSAAVLRGDRILSNVIASQKVHEQYGGVVPELASRAHQQNIVPVVDAAIRNAGIEKKDINAVAFTRGPGLLGSLMVGVSFAKSFAQALDIPLIEVNHLQGHVLSNFIRETDESVVPQFPFVCLLVSGGHTQILLLRSHFEMEVLGQTIDDAAGEAIDKAAKIMDLGYPGGPIIDRLAEDPVYIEKHKADLCASIQKCIVGFLIKKLEKAVKECGARQIAIAGGVSANSLLRSELQRLGDRHHWQVFIPKFQFCTDNAAMVGIAGYYKYLRGEFADIALPPYAR